VEDIAAWQAGWNTPSDVLAAVVRRAAGSAVLADERILAGHGNEVHAITTVDGRQLIVRVNRRGDDVFARELWPISAARGVGIPVPAVLVVEHLDLHGEAISVQVQQRLPGRSVYEVFRDRSDDRLRSLTRIAGAVLARIHAIQPPGAGPIRPDGEPWGPPSRPSGALVTAMVERTQHLMGAGLDRTLLVAAVDAAVAAESMLDDAPVSLIHGDWRTTNVLTDGGSITGVVDWEGARGGDAAADLAGVWTVPSLPDATTTELLVDGYRDAGGDVSGTFELRRLVYRVADLHSAFAHFTATSRPDLLAVAVEDLTTTLRELDSRS
jgi:aminoglycoside phosphotransferase (APT) family kinase protein